MDGRVAVWWFHWAKGVAVFRLEENGRQHTRITAKREEARTPTFYSLVWLIR